MLKLLLGGRGAALWARQVPHTFSYLLAASVVVCMAQTLAGCSIPVTSIPVIAQLDWKLASSFPNSSDRGVMLYPTDMNPSAFTVDFDFCKSTGSNLTYTLTVDGKLLENNIGQCAVSERVQAGNDAVVLTVRDAANQSNTLRETITVRNYFVVSLGDSIASGEGNPDLPGNCDEPAKIDLTNENPDYTSCANGQPVWQPQFPFEPAGQSGSENPQCHRSTKAGQTQAVVKLQDEHPHASFTYLDLACSGAGVWSGLLSSYQGIQHGKVGIDRGATAHDLEPQLQEVNRLRQGRPIDALLMTVGADDIGFSDIVKNCMERGTVAIPVLQQDCGTSGVQQDKEAQFNKDLGTLKANLDMLAACVSNWNGSTCPNSDLALDMDPRHVFIAIYFDPVRNENGQICAGNLLHLSPITSDAWQWAEDKILKPLNDTISTKAQAFGWNVVDEGLNAPDSSNSFYHHGYCSNDTWIRQWYKDDGKSTSDARLGTFAIEGMDVGFLHPNAAGHQRYAQAFAHAMDGVFDFDIPPTSTGSQTGSISGEVDYPSSGNPPLPVYAIEVNNLNHYFSTSVAVNQTTYTIAGVEPGTYEVIAYSSGLEGGYTAAIACGLTANCTDHSLLHVVVAPGQAVTGINTADWYAPAGTFPPQPGT